MSAAAQITLPNGYWVAGAHCRSVTARALTGADEALLIESQADLLPAECATQLLGACVESLEGLSEPDTERMRSLTVGDREALLLHVRRLTVGERLQCVLSCPRAACGERLDVELDTADLLQPPYAWSRPRYDAAFPFEGETRTLSFRLPNGQDQELAGPRALADPDGAVAYVLDRCVVCDDDSSGVRNGDKYDAHEPAEEADRMRWLAGVQDELGARMTVLDPQAETVLEVACAACGEAFTSLLDAGSFLRDEVGNAGADLYREVHLLAFNYHWSEHDILSMPVGKRRRYLSLLQDALSGEAVQ